MIAQLILQVLIIKIAKTKKLLPHLFYSTVAKNPLKERRRIENLKVIPNY